MLMMWFLLTRSTWLSSLITTLLNQDFYRTQPCLLARPTFPHPPPILLPLFPLPRNKFYPCRQSLSRRG
jgi:hypothetical protein